MFAHILYLKPEYLPTRASGEESECGNIVSDANFLTVFRSDYGPILLSFLKYLTRVSCELIEDYL